MKIIEILDEGLGSAIGSAVKGVAKGASEFVSGATGGEIDLERTWQKYIKTPSGTTRSINANLPPEEQFNRILPAIYGKGNVSDQLKQDWAAALESGNAPKIEEVGRKYEHLRREEGLDGDKLKPSHTTVIADLARMGRAGQTYSVEDKEPETSKEEPEEKL